MHLRHVKYQPNGGPDGGDGGDGGSVYLRGNHNYWTLLHLKYQRHVFAEHGGNGGRAQCPGTKGRDEYIDVPCGTVVYDAETGMLFKPYRVLGGIRRPEKDDTVTRKIKSLGLELELESAVIEAIKKVDLDLYNVIKKGHEID